MKRVFLGLITVSLLITACDESSNEVIQTQEIDMSDFYVYTETDTESTAKQANEKTNIKTCFAMQNLNRQLNENPGLERKMYNIEYHTRSVIGAKKGGNGGGNGGGPPGGGGGGGTTPTPYPDTVTIPVVVNVLYNSASENISDAQIQSQIDVLNAAFDGNDANSNSIPSEFSGVKAGNVDIKFVLSAVNSRSTTKTSWPYSSAEEMKHDELGGIDATDTSENLNIWVVSQMPYNGGRILGYAQFPGGDPDTDGIVMDYNDFGTEGTATYPSDLGKVTVHELGHWLNLRHIWGDGRCRQDDFVSDTPNSDRANRGCPTYPTVHCRSNDMTMNYMDYTDDSCLFMFTQGQTDRMRALFATGGARESLVLP